MPNRFYRPGPQRAAKVQDLFSTIATRYDLINDLQSFGLHRAWKRHLCRMAAVKPTDLALDLCCGTGDIALRLARAGARVTGVDFNEPMLAVARTRAQRLGVAVDFQLGDALHLAFPDDHFDVVTIGYGLRNLADVDAGLREMLRVLRRGGRLLILEFGKPPRRVLRAAYFSYLRYWVPLFGRLLCGDPATYAYILDSLEEYPAQEGVRLRMQALGCHELKVINLLGGVMSINYGAKSASCQNQ